MNVELMQYGDSWWNAAYGWAADVFYTGVWVGQFPTGIHRYGAVGDAADLLEVR